MEKNLDILLQFNLLYLEDDESLLKHTNDLLEDYFANVYAVKTSKEALNILRTKKVDVFISDILLENENGIDFLKYLQEKKISIPTILTTAYTHTEYLLEAIKLKVENYIVKPIDINELFDTLYQVLLPIIQEQEIQKHNYIIQTISAVTDSKQVEIIKYLFNSLNQDNHFIGSYSDIMEQFDISKPTLIKLFKELSDKEILVKIGHKTYKFNPNAFDQTFI